MSKTYDKAPKEILNILDQVQSEFHLDHVEAKLRIGVVMVGPEVNKDGEETGPAISKHGHRAVCKTRLVSARDRLNTPYDAMIDIDEKIWETLTEDQQHAMIDSALTAIELIEGKEGDKFAEADDGRPRLKIRKEDFMVSGYEQVIRRHKDSALEYREIKAIWDRCGQGRFAFAADFGEKKKAKAAPADEDDTRSEHEASEERERKSRRPGRRRHHVSK